MAEKLASIRTTAKGSQVPIASGTLTARTGVTISIDCGFQPSKIFIYHYINDNALLSLAYDEDVSSTKQWEGWKIQSGTGGAGAYAIGASIGATIQSITSNGFTFRGANSSLLSTMYYVAIGK